MLDALKDNKHIRIYKLSRYVDIVRIPIFTDRENYTSRIKNLCYSQRKNITVSGTLTADNPLAYVALGEAVDYKAPDGE